MGIGTLMEGGLHADLKRFLLEPGDAVEQPLDGYVIDVVRPDFEGAPLLIEIQTGAFTPLKGKLADLLERYRVRLVVPVARTRFILRLAEDGSLLSRRKSPKPGRVEEVFEHLVAIPHLVGHPRFELELLVTDEEQARVHRPGQVWYRKGWVIDGRALVDVKERRLIRTGHDLAALLPAGLPEIFSTADVASLAKIPRALAQQMLYCLRIAGGVEDAGKKGNAKLYRVTCSEPGAAP